MGRYIHGDVAVSVERHDGYPCPPGFGPFLDWGICGGESGPKARPFDVCWALSAREQCEGTGTAFFMKQLGTDPHDSRLNMVVGWAPGDPEPSTRLRVVDKKGGDMAEFPKALQVREFPRRAA